MEGTLKVASRLFCRFKFLNIFLRIFAMIFIKYLRLQIMLLEGDF